MQGMLPESRSGTSLTRCLSVDLPYVSSALASWMGNRFWYTVLLVFSIFIASTTVSILLKYY